MNDLSSLSIADFPREFIKNNTFGPCNNIPIYSITERKRRAQLLPYTQKVISLSKDLRNIHDSSYP